MAYIEPHPLSIRLTPDYQQALTAHTSWKSTRTLTAPFENGQCVFDGIIGLLSVMKNTHIIDGSGDTGEVVWVRGGWCHLIEGVCGVEAHFIPAVLLSQYLRSEKHPNIIRQSHSPVTMYLCSTNKRVQNTSVPASSLHQIRGLQDMYADGRNGASLLATACILHVPLGDLCFTNHFPTKFLVFIKVWGFALTKALPISWNRGSRGSRRCMQQ